MNLVAKEFVSARDDERGVLVLSDFTGAARELTEALIVNPYDIRQASSALAAALKMTPDEQARAHARDARAGIGAERLPLGRTHAAGRREAEEARAPQRPPGGEPRLAATVLKNVNVNVNDHVNVNDQRYVNVNVNDPVNVHDLDNDHGSGPVHVHVNDHGSDPVHGDGNRLGGRRNSQGLPSP